jgi:signal peptidase I
MRIPGPRRTAGPRRTTSIRERLRGPWRLAVEQASMEPTIAAGDWLLVDPTTARWPRRRSIVVFREPETGGLSVKRVAAGPRDRVPFADGYLDLADDEAWLLADATPALTAAAGYGEPIDSRRFGPVPVELLVGRVWFRYAPWRRIGRLGDAPADDADQGPEPVSEPPPPAPPG